ncbi:hypothetical protein B0J11DRAFT_615791 [Dendryphion nanum]|uniref:Uncharacterized protein n=1 Tax=Dendryphion nanum TaxID=256645 RepID=A0A9P9IJ14_9PLEO|nr:hypothetical protein B0J11DRAFT_615791 [Dendryphion nanum]
MALWLIPGIPGSVSGDFVKDVNSVDPASSAVGDDEDLEGPNGSVLVTPRIKSVASQLVEHSDILHIEPMGDANAQTLLRRELGGEVDEDMAVELATALEFMPLALVQAAA